MNTKTLELLDYDRIIKNIEAMAISEAGKLLVRKIHPSNAMDRIQAQLAEVSEAKSILHTSSSIPLQTMHGIEGIIEKVNKGLALHPEELAQTSMMLSGIRRLKSFMEERRDIAPRVAGMAASMYEMKDIEDEINTCIYNNRVDDAASKVLEKIRQRIVVVEGRIKSRLEAMVKSTAYKQYLQDTTISIKNDHFVLAVKSECHHHISGSVISKSATGSTFFIEPSTVGQMQSELNMLKMDEEREEYQILMFLTSLITEHQQEIRLNIETLSYYDFLFAKAKHSLSINGRPAKLNHQGLTIIHKGRHPMLGKDCVPLDFTIGEDYKALVITGPNTGGKTLVLKTIGLLTAMLQSGLHVPVDQGSEFAIYTDILVDIGDGQSIEQSLSTFSSHIKNIVEIMKVANPYTLVLLDEIGAGTDPMEGEGLAVAIMDEIFDRGATLISTSHYGEVKDYAEKKNGFKNGKMIFDIESLKPTYRLEIGAPGESNAFIIALRLGMAQHVIEKAHMVTYDERKDYSHMQLLRKSTRPPDTYQKAKRPKSIKRQIEQEHKKEHPDVTYRIGDAVYIHTLKKRGIVFEEENKKGEIGLKVKDKKLYIQKKRLSMFIEREQLYPDLNNYDMDIVLESKENRKKNHQMGRKFNKDLEIVHKEGSDSHE